MYFTGRARNEAPDVLQEMKAAHPIVQAQFVPMDHSRLASVRDALARLDPLPRLDILMCNAGVMACGPMSTPDGFDVQFGINYMSHALIARSLMPVLLRTQKEHYEPQCQQAQCSAQPDSVRIIIQTSEAYMLHPPGGLIFQHLRNIPGSPSRMTLDRLLTFGGDGMRYAESQLANMLFTLELAHRYPEILSVAVMPVISNTRLIQTRSLFNRMLIYATNTVKSPEEGCRTQVWAAGSCRYKIDNGGYYQAVAVEGLHVRESRNGALAKELWAWTDEQLEKFAISL
jgi:NAD(P)-dependent dehydrogenase (short-subunit alcohol dehydrogenase family)